MWHRGDSSGFPYYWARPANGLRTGLIHRSAAKSSEWVWHATQRSRAGAVENSASGKSPSLKAAKADVAHAWRHMMTASETHQRRA